MYCIEKLCRICIQREENMLSIYDLDQDNITFYNKLLSCVPELKSEKIIKGIFLCNSCCNNIRNLYNFRNICLKNSEIFEGYIGQLTKNGTKNCGNLLVNLNKNNEIPTVCVGEPHTMTYNEELTSNSQENLYYTMSNSEDYLVENCTPVSASQMNYLECSQNIQDLSQSTSNTNLHFFDSTQNLDNNTDGEITNMIESFCVEMPNDDTSHSEMIFDQPESSQSIKYDVSDIDVLEDTSLNHQSVINDTNFNNPQINYINGENQNKSLIFENSDIKILDTSSCNFQILNLIQNNENVQFIINSSDLSQLMSNNTQQILNINLPQNENNKMQGNVIFKPMVNQKPTQNITNKKIKMSSEEIEQSVAKKVKTIMDSLAVNNETNIKKPNDGIAKNGTCSTEVETPKVEKKNEPIKCVLCGNMYKDQASLRKHKYIVHEAQASFKCDFCGKAFKTSYRCRYHMKLHLTNQKGPDLCKCEFCGEIFSNIMSFETHAQNHGENVALLCVLCEDRFPDTKIFESHMKSHLGSAMYKCQHCELEFERYNDLRSHQRTHTGQQLFVCPVCNKNYCNRNSLNRHILKTHENFDNSLVPNKKV